MTSPNRSNGSPGDDPVGVVSPRPPSAGWGRGVAASTGLVSIGTSDTRGTVVALQPGYLRRLSRMRRGVLASARLIQESLQIKGFRYRAAMITLTYAAHCEWSPLHVAEYLKCVREWARRRQIPLRYVWVMELTKAGKPHYHCLFWLPRGYSMPMADKQGWWKHGSTRSEWARSPVGYLVKYASKGAYWAEAQDLPVGARLWASGGLTPDQVRSRAWYMAPMWLRELVPAGDGVRRDPHGWWRNAATGWGYRSPWVVDISRGVLRWIGWTVEDISIPGVVL